MLTLVNDRCSGITMRCVSTVSTSARMLRSPAATNSSMRVGESGAIDPGQVVIAAVPRQHHVGAESNGGTGEFVDQVGGKERHVDRADERQLQTRLGGCPQSPAVASSGPTPRTSSRSTSACSAGNGCPGAAITKTGEQRGLTVGYHVFDERRCRQYGKRRLVPAHSPRSPTRQHDRGQRKGGGHD